MRKILSLVLLACFAACSTRPQTVDLQADTFVARPTFTAATGPRIGIDQGHNNFHTVEGRYAPFANVLRADGYRVSGVDRFTDDALKDVEVLVVANPLHESDVDNWVMPNPPAFSAEDVAVVRRFVEEGGSLLLILDHMPFPGGGANLAEEFGFKVLNGFAVPKKGSPRGRKTHFKKSDGGLVDHPILRGLSPADEVDEQVSFNGTAFSAPPSAQPLLRFTPRHAHHVLLPDVAWEFTAATPRVEAAGLLQGATLRVGKGRVAVFGEAAMFTAQDGANGKKMGFNAPEARQNKQFLLNVMHWLTENWSASEEAAAARADAATD